MAVQAPLSPQEPDQKVLPCDACDEPAKFLNYRVAAPRSEERVAELKVCDTHDRLAREYKPLHQDVAAAKREEWFDRAIKEESHAAGEILLDPNRDETFRSRRLNNRELQRDSLDRPPPGGGAGGGGFYL